MPTGLLRLRTIAVYMYGWIPTKYCIVTRGHTHSREARLMLRLRAMWPTQLARLTPAPAIMRGMGLRAPPLLIRQQGGRPMCSAPLDTNTFGNAPQDLPTVDRVQMKVSRSRSSSLSISPGNMPHALLKTYKPTSPGRRHRIVVDRSHLWPGRPVRRLTRGLNQCAGRNKHGHITVRGRMARKHRRLYRAIDFHRARTDPAVVRRFEYDPNRSTFIALIQYTADRQLSYILAPRDLAVGSTVTCGEEAPFAPGNAMPLAVMPEGALVHNIEMRPGSGGKLVRGAGTCATLMSKEENFVLLKMPSSEIRKIPKKCTATIGQLSNDQHKNRQLGKAGASAWIGRRSKTRGVAMNAVDHPMGGGEGKSSGGRPSSSPWGWYTKGLRTRKTNQYSSKMIMRRRNHEKLGLATTNKGGW